MSILIKNVVMPHNCHECDAIGISDIVGLECKAYSFIDRPKDCPLVEVLGWVPLKQSWMEEEK